MLDYETCKGWTFAETTCTFTTKDTMLYALSLGLGEDPTDPATLRFVHERNLVAFPTIAAVLGGAGMWMADARTGIDTVKLVHGEQRIEWKRPLPAEGAFRVRHCVERVVDKGAGKGALLVTRKELIDAVDGSLVCTARSLSFLRGDGGFSQGRGGDPEPDRLPSPPARDPDLRRELRVLPQAALLYRLNGDRNPLHADPQVAAQAGFARPILHGLCTYGMAARVIVDELLDGDVARLASYAVRFTAPVLPGETLRVDVWKPEHGVAQLRVSASERAWSCLTTASCGCIEPSQGDEDERNGAAFDGPGDAPGPRCDADAVLAAAAQRAGQADARRAVGSADRTER